MRLIDADALVKKVRQCKEAVSACTNHYYLVGYASALSGVEGQIVAEPTIDAEPVRHGEWIWVDELDGTVSQLTCSVCGEVEWVFETAKYCPHCGAKMDLEVQDEDD